MEDPFRESFDISWKVNYMNDCGVIATYRYWIIADATFDISMPPGTGGGQF